MTADRAFSDTCLALCVEHMGQAVIVCDAEDRVIHVNPAFLSLYGYDEGEIIGCSFGVLFKSINGKDSSGYIRKPLPKKVEGLWIYQCKKNGIEFPAYLFRNAFSWNESGYIVTCVREVSELTRSHEEIKRLEDENRKLESYLRQAQRLEIIGSMAGGIAHDFNNILGSITGYAEMIEEDVDPEHVAAQNIKEVLIAAERARNLIAQILTFTHKAPALSKELDFCKLLMEALKLAAPSLSATINVAFDLSLSPAPVVGDADQLLRMILNLIINAAHAITPNSGTITISLSRVDQSEEDVELLSDYGVLKFVVHDNGCGITDSQLERIFDPLYSSRMPGVGNGIGLAVVGEVIRQHHGRIKANSIFGKETSFTVYLPLSEGKSVEHGRVAAKVAKISGRVLLVEDDEALLSATAQILSRLGLEVVSANSATKAMETFAENPESFCCVITDQTMPIITGNVLAQKMWQLNAQTKIILCTGYNELIDEEEARRIGFAAFLKKPVSQSTYAKVCAEVINGKDA
ncbi:MAG: response regulator [Deltaproteobacteria bacterium]|nr:response regulator [Deltaproteobacteria bacterium]